MTRYSVTREQIACAKKIGIEEYLLHNEPNNIRRIGNAIYLKDHTSFEASNGLWNWHSQGIGGKNVLDYLIKVRGYGFVDAVRCLADDGYSINLFVPQKARPPNEIDQSKSIAHQVLKLPIRNTSNDQVIAYLESRGVSKLIIDECIRRNILYESGDGWHNCVFLGKDESGKTRFAAIRGTRSDFKRDAQGSDKRFGFTLPPDFGNINHPKISNLLAVFESPIDAISHLALEPQFTGWRLSLGGTALIALTQFLDIHAEIREITVCTDNDEAGNLCATKITELFQGKDTSQVLHPCGGERTKVSIQHNKKVIRSLPPNGTKDWNEALQQTQKEVKKEMDDKRKVIRFINSDYDTLFTVKDGESIKMTSGYDGEVKTLKVRYIDETHFELKGKYSDTYHICQFAEIMERNGNKIEAIPDQEPMLDILYAGYGEKLADTTVPMTEDALQKLVGGMYETEVLYYPSRTEQVKDKKVEIKGRAFAAVLRGSVGIAVCGLADYVLTSLHPYDAQTQKRELSVEKSEKTEMYEKPEISVESEISTNPRKPSLLANLEDKKAKVSQNKANAEPPKAKSNDGLEV
jgi:hypothetical protein